MIALKLEGHWGGRQPENSDLHTKGDLLTNKVGPAK